jgi:DnaJ-domain-containing protein 1
MPWLIRFALYSLMFMGTYWLVRRLRAHMASSLTGAHSQATGDRDEAAETNRAKPLDPWAVLELEPGASSDEIHAAYKAQLLKYHPDRVSHLGDEFQQLAHRKTLAIRQAYTILKNH